LLDVPGATLLGERQLAFLSEWTADWSGQDMKAVLSQAPFAGVVHVHGPTRERLAADLDSNGWPRSARERAVAQIRKGFAIMINGDQHLATVFQHGLEDWGDSSFSFSMPSIHNHYRRWWRPLEPEQDQPEGTLEHTGRYTDGFGNKITMYAYANPDPTRRRYDRWRAQAAGYGLIRFNKRTREIIMECWPRGCDVADPECQQYAGWPITIDQGDNYGRDAIAYLPELEIHGREDPVVQIIDDFNDEVVYTLRINGTFFQPKVFRQGSYTIRIGEGEATQVLAGVPTLAPDEDATIEVVFD
jgi:hypothetical protein